MMLRQGTWSPTAEVLLDAQSELLSAIEGSSVIWCGRGATALYWAYRMACSWGEPVAHPEIILPAISCASPALSALAAECVVRFADVCPDTGMVTMESIKARLSPATKAVVFIHLYGQTQDLQELAAWCKANHLLLIEDVAQAQGARLPNGCPAGSVGDVAIFSFNRTKILRCGGGALVLRSRLAEELWGRIGIPDQPFREIDPVVAAELGLSERNLYHALVTLQRLSCPTGRQLSMEVFNRCYSQTYVRSMLDPAKLASAWTTLPRELELRAAKADLYRSRLSRGPWRLLDGCRASGVCWRYSLLVDFPGKLTEFTHAVRQNGFYVSNLYWPLNTLLNPADVCPSAEEFGRRCVNLWVDDSVSPDWVTECAEVVRAEGERLAADIQHRESIRERR